MSSEASPGMRMTWISIEPFRRLMKYKGLICTADTTGTLMSIGAERLESCFRTDLELQRAMASMMSEGSTKRDSIFGCLIDSMSPKTSPGTG